MTPRFSTMSRLLPAPELLPFILNSIAGSWCLRIMGDEPSDLRDGGRIVPLTLTAALSLSLHLPQRLSSTI